MDCDQVPPAGQLRRLAEAALDQQGITIRRLRRMRRHSNHLFRADTKAGQQLVVRVCLPGGRSDAELDAELAWLAALARDTGLTVPVPRFSTHVASPGLSAGARCIGFTWVQGRPAARGRPRGWSPTWAGSSAPCTHTPPGSARRPGSPGRRWISPA
jgi:Ser/Thr protein kinase RdoA (MazF antagonist)